MDFFTILVNARSSLKITLVTVWCYVSHTKNFRDALPPCACKPPHLNNQVASNYLEYQLFPGSWCKQEAGDLSGWLKKRNPLVHPYVSRVAVPVPPSHRCDSHFIGLDFP